MKRIVNSSEMKALDQNTIKNHQIPSLVLMERAALAVYQELQFHDLTNTLVICGSGNNGGDGIAVARMLHLAGKKVHVFLLGNPLRQSEDCRNQMMIAQSYGVTFVNNPVYSEYTTIVDAIFGVGLSRDIEGQYKEVIQSMNASRAQIVAVDIPSGINADHGAVMGCAVEADTTVTFAYAKTGHLLFPGKSYTGKLSIHDIGIYEDCASQFEEHRFMLEKNDLKMIPLRDSSGNKGTFGKVLVIAGSEGMAGAAILCARAAMRTGCGMVKIITHESNRQIVQLAIPEAMTGTYHSLNEAISEIEKGLAWANVAAIGPGIGLDSISEWIISYVIEHALIPLVIDADGLNVLSNHKELLGKRKAPIFVTPHLGEMARLIKRPVNEIKEHIIDMAREFAQKNDVYCILKDAVTCIASPQGKIILNVSGNSGMATAGSGDVLTGIIAAMIAVKVPEEYCGALGVYIHGLAGDAAKQKCGEAFLMAGDLIEELKLLRLGEQ